MITIKALEEKYIENIVNWCAGKDADFLRQWAGQGYEYPLTVNQIVDRLAEGAQIYEFIIDNKIVGTIEVIKIDNETKTANLGRFVLDQSLTAK